MRINDILRGKGTEVATITPQAPIAQLLTLLAAHNVGALPVVASDASVDISSGSHPVVGMASERDVVRRLNDNGVGLLDRPVGDIMSTTVTTCRPDDAVDDIMRVMTNRRIRHVPVVEDGQLVGIVSIGDIVKSRISELEEHRSHLEAYIASGG
ncbi:CBS domain-containing protein [Fodinicola acaciae]|uniref:CBS domain-containing protein n=1 Tax=Fodinicola acaciae TaxID=2681555 RepID=UPI0013D35F5F|nr:CBS domain-containing protein [Fodinicola acaciae]